MCGIAGAFVFNKGSFTVTGAYIDRIRDTMQHRGPDGNGTWCDSAGRIGLGHCRLSIIDLSPAASQPMCNEDESLWISYNGEIYNHAELRAEIETTGRHCWKTDHSDTEVILHAFEEWGIDCLERLRGVFAFAIWDASRRRLWLARDRIGVKPLYYSIHHERITFASEIKALLMDPEQKRGIHEEAFYHYLSFLTTPAPQTLFEGIRKLPAATWMCVQEDGSITERQYWDVWDNTELLSGASESEIAERVLEELRSSVRYRKISDVPVGVFLSGGVDSSANTALFSEGESRSVQTFSIGYDGKYSSYTNELSHARVMANAVGTDHHERILTADDLLELLPEMVRLQDEPLADPVCFPIYCVAQLARQHGVIVCQVGEGADELFCGYPEWKTALRLQRLNDLPGTRILKHLTRLTLGAAGRQSRYSYEWLCRGLSGQPIFWGGAESFLEFHKRQLLSERLRKRFRAYSSWEVLHPIRRQYEEKAWEQSALNWMSYLDLNLRLPELLLMRVDKMSMGSGLEARVPFLDHKFVELAMSIPAGMKTKNGSLKYILIEAVRELVPKQLIERRKQGFGVPIQEWLSGDLREHSQNVLMDFCAQTDLLDVRSVKILLDSQTSHQIWHLFNLALWWKAFICQ